MQINRLFEIVYILLDKKLVTARELAEKFEVSTRTIYRDIDALSMAGIPIYSSQGKGGGISLLPDFVLNKTVFTQKEKVDILTSLRAMDTVKAKDDSTALQKLNSLFGECNTDWIEVDFTTWDNVQESGVWDLLKTAVINKNLVNFSYFSGKGEHTTRVVEPVKICFKGQAWYLYAYCRDKSDFRFFKLSRMKQINILEETFKRNPPNKIFGNKAEKDIFGEKNVSVTLEISGKMAFRVYDEFYDYQITPDGDFIVKFQMPPNEWFFNYIMSFGSYCKVAQPAEIREEMKKRLCSMLDNYGEK